MKRGEYCARATINFFNLTLQELAHLEAYLKDGLEDGRWGNVTLEIEAKMTGEREEHQKDDKKVTAKKLLDLEKKGAAKG